MNIYVSQDDKDLLPNRTESDITISSIGKGVNTDYIISHKNALNVGKNNFPYFWGGEDICTCEEIVIEKGEITKVKVLLKPENLPNFENFEIAEPFLKMLNVSTRSCFAQSGVHLSGESHRFFNVNDFNILNSGNSLEYEVMLENTGNANILIGKGEALFRFYWINRMKNILKGEDLYSSVINGEFSIEGNYGESWQMMDVWGNLLKEKDIGRSERLILFLTQKKYQPTSDSVIKVSSKNDLGKVLVPFDELSQIEHFNFEIGETSPVCISNSIVGVIEEGGYDGGTRHISSPLIDPGFSGPIRTEIIGSHGNRNNFIELTLLKKNHFSTLIVDKDDFDRNLSSFF